jgi:elongation factor P
MIDTGDLRRGITIEIDGVLYQVLEFNHLKLGRGSAQVRMKLKDVRAGHTIERTVQAGSKFARARVERQSAQYLYADGDLHYFMNTETYDQIALNTSQLGDAINYLTGNATCDLLTYEEQPIGIELSAAVELAVAQTDPWVRGDTAQGGTKPATLETGLLVQVPLFINTGDRVKVDTRSGEYLGKA